MGSVAAAMKAKGYKVTGSDQNVYPPMSTFLESQGVEIFSGYKAEHIPDDADVVIIGNAISRGNPEAEEALNRKLLYSSLPEVLKDNFLRGKKNLVVSGTHGKTTTTSMLTWILESAGKNMGKGARFTNSEFTVLEGDEYDTAFFDKRSKFLHYLPEVVIMNNIEFDHADIYNNIDEIKLTFERLLKVVPENGMAFINGDDENCLSVSEGSYAPVKKVGMGETNDVRIENVSYEGDNSSFTLSGESYTVPMSGEFNVRNAAMAVNAALFSGLTPDEIREGLSSFSGIARRQELKGEANGVKVIDDFAHHPTAIDLAIDALRQRYPSENLWVLFEPRSNSTRRKVFQQPLADALARADKSIIAGVPGAETLAPEERLDPTQLADDITSQGTDAWFIDEVDDIVKHVAEGAQPGDVVAVLSNGGFGGIHQKLLDALATK